MIMSSRKRLSKGITIMIGGLLLGGVAALAVRQRIRRPRSAKHLVKDVIRTIQARVQHDEGGRGISKFSNQVIDDLEHAADSLVDCAGQTVAILTGFPCLSQFDPPTETDGPNGAFAIARACVALGKQVIIVTDDVNADVLMAATAGCGIRGSRLSLESFPCLENWDDEDEERLLELAISVDTIVCIERPGLASDDKYYTMRGVEMKNVISPIDKLLKLVTSKQQKVLTVAIGDGGNEVGMGKICTYIINNKCIPHADKITCITPTDHLIVASVSNWGGYALCASMAAMACSKGIIPDIHAAIYKMMPNEQDETAMMSRILDAGARDGITGENHFSVDGMPFEMSLKVITDLKDILIKSHLSSYE